MQSYADKVNNLPTDSTGVLTAEEFNNFIAELENAISTTGQTLSGANLYQIAAAMVDYAVAGEYYQDSGAANTYTLSVIGSMRAPHAYLDGMKVRFFAANSNTGASTVNLATIGSKDIKRSDGSALQSGDIQAGAEVEIIYRSSLNYFILSQNVKVSGNQTIQGVKTFTTAPESTSDPTNNNGLVRRLYADLTYVGLTGNQTIAGTKTFSSVPGSSQDPVSGNDLVRLSYLTNVVPAGTIGHTASSTTPSGYLLCYGQAVSRTTYAALFTAIGTTYGSGDGSTTFNVPDNRQRAIIGKGNMGGTDAARMTAASVSGEQSVNLGGTGGADTHILTVNELPGHTHDLPRAAGTGGSGNFVQADNTQSGTFATGSTGAYYAHSNTQPWIAFNTIIKV